MARSGPAAGCHASPAPRSSSLRRSGTTPSRTSIGFEAEDPSRRAAIQEHLEECLGRVFVVEGFEGVEFTLERSSEAGLPGVHVRCRFWKAGRRAAAWPQDAP